MVINQGSVPAKTLSQGFSWTFDIPSNVDAFVVLSAFGHLYVVLHVLSQAPLQNSRKHNQFSQS